MRESTPAEEFNINTVDQTICDSRSDTETAEVKSTNSMTSARIESSNVSGSMEFTSVTKAVPNDKSSDTIVKNVRRVMNSRDQ